ncbi:acyl-CoA synthetase (AMP-forming)/AMP-acid ligase II [Paenibacillus endophyticus]|uniref:Acyl-CoA synthetase (AMP-forming)/AMP-acid ligase II n=1 Tax=Paenibacillus endophyticus TaxID=1294268 RepID=A0A7W5CA24_9BACL|nr:class I adenylate-forming enzyme family protein [Paenibacillus endophyticus]MBB3153932.1 acyl-CoA synthetase (AMP-forming)/AMP-acid ligase II [Paenibacillus endophyticus]
MLLSKILPQTARVHPNSPAMKDSKSTLSYQQLLTFVNRVAQGYIRLGIQPGERIALLGYPSKSLAISELAAVAIEAIPFAIAPELTSPEIEAIIQNANPKLIVYDPDLPFIDTFLQSLSSKQAPIPLHSPFRTTTISDFMENESSYTPVYEAKADDVSLIIYTGGTTGRSKGVIHSHRSIRSWSFLNPERGGGHHSTKKSIVPNQAHLTGQFILWTTLFEGGCLIYPNAYPLQATELVDIIEREQIQYLGTVGLLFRDMATLEEVKTRNFSSIKGVSCGGAPISANTFHRAAELFPHAQLNQVYAQTESGQFISYLSINECFLEGKLHRLASVGNPSHLARWGQKPFKLRLIDDYGTDVALGDIGEVICQGEQIMLGYWNNPVDTEQALRNGWLHTGDMGRFDEDGYLYLVDRKKEIVIVDASNVYCGEVEQIISQHPSVLEVAVLGTPLPHEGEQVTAVVVLKKDASLTIDQIKLFCLSQLAGFKIPTRLVIEDVLPRTAVGKINKAEIRRRI